MDLLEIINEIIFNLFKKFGLLLCSNLSETSKNEKGNVVFNTDLIKIKISIKNAEKIFKEAVKVLKGKMPKASEDCQYCKWVKEAIF